MASDSKLWQDAYKSFRRGQSKTRPQKQQRIKVKQLNLPKPKRRKKAKLTTIPIKLYALELEGGCYYIGQATDPEKRFKRHVSGKGALWTKKYRPIRIIEVRETGSCSQSKVALLEDKMTFEYVAKYGISYVRGGGYCQTRPRWPVGLGDPVMRRVAPNVVEKETIDWLNSWI